MPSDFLVGRNGSVVVRHGDGGVLLVIYDADCQVLVIGWCAFLTELPRSRAGV